CSRAPGGLRRDGPSPDTVAAAGWARKKGSWLSGRGRAQQPAAQTKSETNPNSEFRKGGRQNPWSWSSVFGLRKSFGFRISDFGFHPSFGFGIFGQIGLLAQGCRRNFLGDFNGSGGFAEVVGHRANTRALY